MANREPQRQAVLVSHERGLVRFSCYVAQPGERLQLGTACVDLQAAASVYEDLGRILARAGVRRAA